MASGCDGAGTERGRRREDRGRGRGEPSEPASGARNPERHRAGVGVAQPRCPAWAESASGTLLQLKATGLRLPDPVSKKGPREVRREDLALPAPMLVWA